MISLLHSRAPFLFTQEVGMAMGILVWNQALLQRVSVGGRRQMDSHVFQSACYAKVSIQQWSWHLKPCPALRATTRSFAKESLELCASEEEGIDAGEAEQGEDEVANDLAAMTGTITVPSDVPIFSNSLCVGIDPDLSGAIAVLRTQNNSTVSEVMDVPCVKVTVNKRIRRRHDYASIATMVRQLDAPQGSIAYVEQAMPFPKDGKQGWYITGYGYGVWLGILAAAGFTIIPVQARVWKSAMGICGKEFTKDDSRSLASSMFPTLSPQLQRKKDHGRAEALLIAAFGKGMTLINMPALHEETALMNVSSSEDPPF